MQTLLLGLAVCLAALPSFAQQPERITRLDSVLTSLHDDSLFSGAVAISDADGRVVYRFTAGDKGGTLFTTTTPVYVASVSKAMTAAAALSLAADGQISLDDDVANYLDPWPYDDITVRDLANQTAGLHWLGTVTAHRDTTRLVTTADLLALVAEHEPPLNFEPGTQFAYSNANFTALAAVLEAATGQPYAEVLRERVFEPANMTTAFVAPSGENDWIAWVGGDGDAVHASVEDLLAFDDAFWAGRIVPDSLVRAALVPPLLADGSASRYVFGRFVRDAPWPIVGHWGDGIEVKTGLWREEGGMPGATYAIEATDEGVYRTPILGAVISIWKGEPFELPRARPVADVPDEVLARHVGSYSSGMGLLHITLEDGQLHLEPEGAGGSEPLIPASETVFYFGHQDLTWEFQVDETGRTMGLMLKGHPETLGQRVEAETRDR